MYKDLDGAFFSTVRNFSSVTWISHYRDLPVSMSSNNALTRFLLFFSISSDLYFNKPDLSIFVQTLFRKFLSSLIFPAVILSLRALFCFVKTIFLNTNV